MDTTNSGLRPIPTGRTRDYVEAKLSQYAPWFYKFMFSNGAVTESQDDLANLIHDTRASLLFPFLDAVFHGRWQQVRCLDLACHEGWFGTQIALRGAQDVIGIDIRQEHIAKASIIKELGGIDRISFRQGDIYELKPEQHGTFELTLFLGILYHLENPMGALRAVRSVTRSLCVIESQVARPGVELECLWGSGVPRRGPSMALVRSDEGHVEPGRPVVLVPSLEAMYEMLYAAGFDRLYLSVPPRSAYQQYANHDRVIVFAQVL